MWKKKEEEQNTKRKNRKVDRDAGVVLGQVSFVCYAQVI